MPLADGLKIRGFEMKYYSSKDGKTKMMTTADIKPDSIGIDGLKEITWFVYNEIPKKLAYCFLVGVVGGLLVLILPQEFSYLITFLTGCVSCRVFYG
jgi:hypothetical protein